jgi:hypothetical protein
MLRALVAIVAALKLSNPSLPDGVAHGYAKTIQADAKKRYYDPYTSVAIVWHESRVNSRIVKTHGDESYVGLGQIRLKNFAACRTDINAAECQAIRARLLVGTENLTLVGMFIEANRQLCRRKTGRAPFAGWLAGYQGFSTGCSADPKKIPRMTWRVIRYRAWLERMVPRHMRGLPCGIFPG